MVDDMNQSIIDEFRANDGKVGGPFEGGTLLLLHHVGRKSGTEYVNPLAYLQDETDADTMYIFGSAAGRPKDPAWVGNAVAMGETTVEVGTQTVPVRVETLSGEERERIWSAMTEVMPGFLDYEKKTEGIRTIPVLALHRVV